MGAGDAHAEPLREQRCEEFGAMQDGEPALSGCKEFGVVGGDGGGGGEVDGGDKLDRGLGGAEAEESEDATKSRTELTYVKCASRLAGEPAGAAQSL
jgi:hypothetical protein